MNILIADDHDNLRLFINIDKIGHMEFNPTAAVMYFAPGHEVWTDSTRLFVIGNSSASHFCNEYKCLVLGFAGSAKL